MSEFSDRPLVIGSLTGIRSFRVDTLGRLTGVHVPEVFRPGVNVATCTSSAAYARYQRQALPTSFAWALSTGVRPRETTTVAKPAPHVSLTKHRVAQLSCSCGYYAYFDTAANPNHLDGNIEGLIRGYGAVTVGSRGFRSAKAGLLALIDERPPLRRRADADTWVTLGITVGNLAWVGTAIGLGFTVWSWLANLCIGLFYLYATTKTVKGHKGIPDAVRRNYPDVPVYTSRKAALRDFPLTAPEPLTPDADPEFWTRSAS